MVLLMGGGGSTDLSAATAIPSRVLLGDTFFSSLSDEIQVGTIPNRGAVTITPSASAQTIPEGYHNGSGTVPAVSFTASNVLIGTTIAGTAGTMPNYSGSLLTSTSYSDTGSTIRLNTPNTGYMYAGSTGLQITYANLRNLIGLTDSIYLLRNRSILGISGNSRTFYSFTTAFTGNGNSYRIINIPSGFYPHAIFITCDSSVRTNQGLISMFIDVDTATRTVYASSATGINTVSTAGYFTYTTTTMTVQTDGAGAFASTQYYDVTILGYF